MGTLKSTYQTEIDVGALLLLTGCTDNPDLPVNTDSYETFTTHISLTQALATASEVMQEFDPAIRSHERIVKEISVISPHSVRSSNSADTDSLLYIVNYDNNEGFVILGTDTRMKPVYAISPNGQFKLSDDNRDAALEEWLEIFREQASASISSNLNESRISSSNTQEIYANIRNTGTLLPDSIAEFSLARCNKGTSSLSLSLFKLIYAAENVPGNHDASYKWAYRGLAEAIKANDVVGPSITAMVESVNTDLKERNNNFEQLLGSYHIAIFTNIQSSKGAKYDTGCEHNSYWNISLSAHPDQMYRLLSFDGTGVLSDLYKQPVMAFCLSNTYVDRYFIIDGARYRDKYVYSKLTNKIVSGPTPEYWYHCVWSNNTDNNGYYLYLSDSDSFDKLPSSTTRAWNLWIYGGLGCDKYSGI